MTKICEQISGNKIAIGFEKENRPADLRIYITDNSKIEREIGWSPNKTVSDIFQDIHQWIVKNEKQLENILK
jgi:CDP-paratose 2-epimerase